MHEIKIVQEQETDSGWRFRVSVDGQVHKVTVGEDFWQAKTKGQETPESLVRRTFEFLLEREPKESILTEFDLKDILNYFPEYDTQIEIE